MGGFEYLEHTADIGMVARGDTMAEALSYLAAGMFSVVADLDAVTARQTRRVSVTSADTESLAVDWLNELLFHFEASGFLPKEFHVTADDGGTSLVARCVGERADTERHHVRAAVKAATYHLLQVSHDGGWRIQVILDM